MFIDDGGGYIRVTQQFLHRADVGARLQQMRGEAVAQGEHRHGLDDARQQCHHHGLTNERKNNKIEVIFLCIEAIVPTIQALP